MPDNRTNRYFSARKLAILLVAVGLIASFGARQALAAPFVYATVVTSVSSMVEVIDTATNAIVATIMVPINGSSVAITPEGKRVYVAGLTSTVNNTALVYVIDTATNTVVATIPVPAPAQNGSVYLYLAISPDGKTVYETTGNFGPIAVIDTATNSVVTTVPVPPINSVPPPFSNGGGGSLAISPDGHRLYLGSGNVIDTATNMVVATIPIQNFGPNGYPVVSPAGSLVVSPDGKRLYAAIERQGVEVFDTSSNMLVALVTTEASSLAITPDGKYLYSTGTEGGTVSVIDTGTNTEVASIAQYSPGAIGITPDGKRAYVGVVGHPMIGVSVIDTATNTVVAEVLLPPGEGVFAVAAMPLPPGNGATSGFKTNTHDFNGDGYSDIAWRDGEDTAIWLMSATPSGGAQIASATYLGVMSNSWQIVTQRDFNGDGHADLLWSNTNGDNVIWLMNGSQVSQTANLGVVPSGWSVVGTGDFNGDGYGDILWRSTNGDTGIWLMTGSATEVQVVAMVDLGVVPTSWTIAGTGDFNGDGYTDILWYNSNGDTGVWLMTGTATQVQMSSWSDFGMVPTGWTIAGTGDFNGDGYADILWRNSNGDTAIWLMTGTPTQVLMSSTNDLGVVPTSWAVAVTGDFNADGKSDILWSNTNGDTAIWFMNGAVMSSVSDLGNVPYGWVVQGAGAD
jgi:YVTN family beta-propeller protein